MTSEQRLLDGKVAIVTGASRGIGRGIAKVLAGAGAQVAAVGRDEASLAAVAGEIEAAGGGCLTLTAEMTDAAALGAMAEQVAERFGGIDVLCHNAGIYPEVELDDMTLADWRLVLETNLTGTFLALKACLPHLRARGAGRVVLVSSITGPITGYPGLAHYGASKGGMNGFMRSAALELAPSNVTINAVEPGSIRTEGLEGLGTAAIADMERCIPLRRLGTPADIGGAVLFLASDLAGFVTGQTLVVDGGQTLPELPSQA
ncbi:MAG: 3-oxoacyl-ACP reductase FabG [Actinobacteria bacterium]|nr:3-oxoacyl-ACP reductase FabG [Actinomycetota bacterium]